MPEEPEDGDLQWLEAAGFVAFDSFEPGLLFGVQKEISDDRALAEPDAFLRYFSEEKDGTLERVES
ncbi:MAG TPA: hypothetical protein VNS09_02220 [Solirubrobacter sp.]|nr:hypothetical protein [Solirubrobacter sp.]